MIEDEISLNDLYNLTRVLLNNETNKEVWISVQVMQRLKGTIDKAMEQGVKAKLDLPLPEGVLVVGGFTFVIKPNIEGVMCFGNESFSLNEKDTAFEEFLSLLNKN